MVYIWHFIWGVWSIMLHRTDQTTHMLSCTVSEVYTLHLYLLFILPFFLPCSFILYIVGIQGQPFIWFRQPWAHIFSHFRLTHPQMIGFCGSFGHLRGQLYERSNSLVKLSHEPHHTLIRIRYISLVVFGVCFDSRKPLRMRVLPWVLRTHWRR